MTGQVKELVTRNDCLKDVVNNIHPVFSGHYAKCWGYKKRIGKCPSVRMKGHYWNNNSSSRRQVSSGEPSRPSLSLLRLALVWALGNQLRMMRGGTAGPGKSFPVPTSCHFSGVRLMSGVSQHNSFNHLNEEAWLELVHQLASLAPKLAAYIAGLNQCWLSSNKLNFCQCPERRDTDLKLGLKAGSFPFLKC